MNFGSIKHGPFEMIYQQDGQQVRTAFSEALTDIVYQVFLKRTSGTELTPRQEVERLSFGLLMLKHPKSCREMEKIIKNDIEQKDDIFQMIVNQGKFAIFYAGVVSTLEARLAEVSKHLPEHADHHNLC